MYMHTERYFIYSLYINSNTLYILHIYYSLCIYKPKYILFLTYIFYIYTHTSIYKLMATPFATVFPWVVGTSHSHRADVEGGS